MSDQTAGVAELGQPDERTARLARLRQLTLARPVGSLGDLDSVYFRVAAIRSEVSPGPLAAAVSVLAGDHGVAARGTSTFRAGVTSGMTRLIAAGQAPVNVLARQCGAAVHVADFGLIEAVGDQRFKVGAGTGDISVTDAMTAEAARTAIEFGRQHMAGLHDGIGMLAVGEIGVGNTTPTAALAVRLVGRSLSELVGVGSGVDPVTHQRKTRLVDAALTRSSAVPDEPVALLAALGGYEIAGNVGVILAAAECGLLVVIDGYITGVAALLASRICPQVTAYLVAAHRSREPGHLAVLSALGLTPLLDLGMHLGMASGATLVLPLINAMLAVGCETPSAVDVGLGGSR